MFKGQRGDCVYENEDGTYSVDNKKDTTYDMYEDAVEFVIKRQQERILNVAEKCKGTIPNVAYEAMLNWDVRTAICG